MTSQQFRNTFARNAGIEVGGDSKKSFARVEKAIDFLTPYLGKDVSEWSYKQISEWDEKQQALCLDLYRAYLLDNRRKDYLNLFRKHIKKDEKARFNLIYF